MPERTYCVQPPVLRARLNTRLQDFLCGAFVMFVIALCVALTVGP